MELRDRRVIVVGLGRSGVAAAQLCLRRGASVVANDIVTQDRATPAMLDLERKGARLILGSHDAICWRDADLVVVSPGVPPLDPLHEVERGGCPVISELDLACRFVEAPVALVGGTNGKSTVTTWLGSMLSEPNKRVFVGGNLGRPLSESVDEPFDSIVLEISSFQSERIPALHPRAAALLNLSDDHLDRYPDFASYANAKGNMFVRMTRDDTAVVPTDDERCRQQARRGNARVITFGAGGDVALDGSQIVHRPANLRFDRSSIRVAGDHNVQNALASVAMAVAMGAKPERIAAALESFTGLPHRTVFVGEIGSVRFYDDSKGTNVGAAVAALRGLQEPRVVLIAGGRDKQGSYEPLVVAMRERGRALVVLGEAADRIALAASGTMPIVRVESMREAVRKAWEAAEPGDAVLLSPACSSFDMFRDYKHRGEQFISAVMELARDPCHDAGAA